MKSKFSLMWRVATALVLVLTLGLVMAAPVSADVSKATVTVEPPRADTEAKYTINFNINKDLLATGTVKIEFDTAYTGVYAVPTSYADGAVTIQGAGVSSVNIEGDATTRIVTITLATPITAPGAVQVIFTTAAHIKNPAALSYTLKVSTSAEANKIDSAAYAILAKPAVDVVQPNSGNRGDTMWIEVTGSSFTGTVATNACTTTLSFGTTEVSVLSYKYIGTGKIDCQIQITGTGTATLNVAATTAAGTGTVTTPFTVNAANTKQVDVWNTYTPTQVVPFTDSTLDFQVTKTGTAALKEAVGAVDGTDTVIVHAATYKTGENFPIIIDNAGLTLKSLSGATLTTIDASGQGSTATLVISDKAGVTIGGSGAGFTIITSGIAGIHVPEGSTGGGTGLQILYNTFQAEKQGTSHGIWIEAVFQAGGSPSRAAKIQYNDFSQATPWADGGYLGAPGTGIQIAKATYAATTPSVISNNTAANLKYTFLAFKPEKASGGGAEVCISGGTTVDGVDVYSNVVHDNGRAVHFAIAKTPGTTPTSAAGLTIGSNGVKVYQNQLYNNGDGVKIDADITTTEPTTASITGEENIKINYNDIYNNTKTTKFPSFDATKNYGIWNGQDDDDVNAKYNWWGALSGPSAGTDAKKSTTALGLGDKVSTDVTYDPWLTEIQAKTVSDGIAYFADTMPLQQGWNTLSVPLALKDSADTMAEIVALGSFLTTTNWEIAYQYNPAIPGWENIGTSAIPLVPCRGYYIKIKPLATVSFPVLYSGTLGLPALKLAAGWNLIGSAFGIDKTAGDYGIAATDDTTDGQKTVKAALDSIGAKCSTVVSPTVPGQGDNVWATTYAAEVISPTNKMFVGESYWVFMTAPDITLAGFEVTPIYKVFLP